MNTKILMTTTLVMMSLTLVAPMATAQCVTESYYHDADNNLRVVVCADSSGVQGGWRGWLLGKPQIGQFHLP